MVNDAPTTDFSRSVERVWTPGDNLGAYLGFCLIGLRNCMQEPQSKPLSPKP